MHTLRRASAFTLIELLVVVAIVGVVAAAVAVGVGQGAPDREMRRALEEAVTELALARVEAMQRGESQQVEMWVTVDAIHTTRGDRERSWKATMATVMPTASVTTRLQRIEADHGPHGGVVAEFDTTGRTRERRWEIWTEDAPGRIWAIEFEPVSGAPRVRKPGSAADAWK